MTEDQDGELPEVVEQVGSIATGLPPQVQKNLWKAAGRALTGMAEWPAAFFEGHAAKTRARLEAEAAETRSQQRAREIMLLGTAEAAARQFNADPDLARRAAEYHAADIIREQATREAVLKATVEDLSASPPPNDAVAEIEQDWLTSFLREACSKSNKELQALFVKILSGEIRAPGSFSIKTLQSMSLLTQNVAQKIQIFCNLSVNISEHGYIMATPFGHAGQNDLKQFGMTYRDLAVLVEYGFVRPDIGERRQLPSILYKWKIPFDYAGMTVFLAATPGTDETKLPEIIRVEGPSLTTVGMELRQIVSMRHVPEYTDKLKEWFRSQQLVMYRLVRREGARLYGEPF